MNIRLVGKLAQFASIMITTHLSSTTSSKADITAIA
jgi:hypothetical protein